MVRCVSKRADKKNMNTQGAPGRQRCTSCRRWYHRLATAKTQQTCSKQCRVKRQRKLAKRRRRHDLAGSRAEERARQQCWRDGQEAAESKQVSRATLTPQVAVLYEKITEDWDKILKLSRARFERKIAAFLVQNTPKLGQSGTQNEHCHAPG